MEEYGNKVEEAMKPTVISEEDKAKILQELLDATPPFVIKDVDLTEFHSPEMRKLLELKQTDIEAFKKYSEQLLEDGSEDCFVYRVIFTFYYKECRKDATLVDKALEAGKRELIYGFLSKDIIVKLFVIFRKKSYYHHAKSLYDMILALPEPKLYANQAIVDYLKGRDRELEKKMPKACDNEGDSLLSVEEVEIFKSRLPDCYHSLPTTLDEQCKTNNADISIEELFNIEYTDGL